MRPAFSSTKPAAFMLARLDFNLRFSISQFHLNFHFCPRNGRICV
jgi:hypothetical protein